MDDRSDRIPFNRPALAGMELEYLRRVLEGRHFAGDGPFTRQCSTLLERELAVPKVLLTTSCTHALEMCAILLDIGTGDEVIVPSFTFVSTANAFVLRGAKPVFVDIRPDTLNMDESLLERAITPRTRAIVPVHYAGVACEMDTIMKIAGKYGIPVVEDNAHGLFGTYKGRFLGTFGALAVQSFHETKNFTCGEGGALLVNDVRFIARAEIIREKGTDRSRYFRGEVDKYTWQAAGSSYLPSDLLSAVLLAQLESRASIQTRRKEIWVRYQAALRDWAQRVGAGIPVVPAECGQSYHLFYILLRTPEQRESFIRHMSARRIRTVFHYLPLHLSAMGEGLGGRPGDCPVAESVADRLVRLPLYHEMDDPSVDTVISAVRDFDPGRDAR